MQYRNAREWNKKLAKADFLNFNEFINNKT